MIKKTLRCVLMIVHVLSAENGRTIDQVVIDQAQKTVTYELAIINRNRLIKAGLSMAVLAASGYGLLKWLACAQPAISPNCQPDNLPANVPIRTIWQVTKGWTGSVARGTVALFSHMIIGNAAAMIVGKSVDFVSKYFQVPDWHWMLYERTKLYLLLGNLKYVAASLDPKSSLFDPLAHVSVSIADYTAAITQQGQLPIGSFDELIKLRLIAQKILPAHRATYEKQLEAVWGLVSEAVIFVLGFVAHKQQITEGTTFDQRQLEVMRDQIIQHTNNVTKQLPDLISQTTSENSGGLLALVYNYCNFIAHTCAILEINEIISSG